MTLGFFAWTIASWIDPCIVRAGSEIAPERPRESHILREANRLLEDEIRLASSPQVYLLLDLTQQMLLIKARGLELHRLPVQGWEVSRAGWPSGIYRLHARPPVDRPKSKPGSDPMASVIELDDMPGEYDLQFDPPLRILMTPPARERPFLWARSRLREWLGQSPTPEAPAKDGKRRPAAWLRLVLAVRDVRALAWSLTDGMPLLIGRSSPDPKGGTVPVDR